MIRVLLEQIAACPPPWRLAALLAALALAVVAAAVAQASKK